MVAATTVVANSEDPPYGVITIPENKVTNTEIGTTGFRIVATIDGFTSVKAS
jgi:hypothetical protein